MTNKKLLEKLKEDMEMRSFTLHKRQLLPKSKRNNRIFQKNNETSKNTTRTKKLFIESPKTEKRINRKV